VDQNTLLAYSKAIELATSHYENFPVISFIIPKKYLYHIAIIYYFARSCDDIADLSEENVQEKLNKLQEYQFKIKNIDNYKNEMFFNALYYTFTTTQIKPDDLVDLINAFIQDLKVNRYHTFNEVLDYTKFSANPVGRMMLDLFNCGNDETYLLSDKICTALQLTNFLQDLKLDLKINRIYLPLNELAYFNLKEQDLFNNVYDIRFQRLYKHQINRIRKLFFEGSYLINYLPFRLKIYIKATVNGGLSILKKIENYNFDIYNNIIKLNKLDYIKLFLFNGYKQRKYIKSKK
jgi:squalene synthase HpnC